MSCDLLKVEWQKVKQQKMVWVLLCLVFIVGLIFSFSRMGLPGTERTNAPFEGKLTRDFVQLATEGEKRVTKNGITKAEQREHDIYLQILKADGRHQSQSQRVDELRQEARLATSDIKKRKLEQEASLLAKIDYQHVGNYRTLDQFIVFLGVGGFALLAIVLTLVTATSFSREAQTGMLQLLYSSKHGRKDVLTAKLALSILLVTGIILVYNIVQWLLFFRQSSGWELPIQFNYHDSPYPLTFGQLYLLAILMQWLVGISLVMTFTFFSLLIRHVLAVLILASICLIGPFILEKFFGGIMASETIRSLLLLTQGQSLMVFVLFRDYLAVPVFGQPIILPVVVIASSIGTILLFGWGCYKLVSRQSA
ncbi:ABC transporter permease subunit [Exiguobacterium sp. s39]|uniref:ABC transporter permease subunit n=1 Tax=Exiguobacterium sp. s39 TaxID=2751198 RepID=UPI001BE50039|nr:ABC transporter permease subunit [Exiguobacterium sp. s39]